MTETQLPMPGALADPRDGEHVEYFPGSDQVAVTGAYRDGLRHGRWTEFFPSGRVKHECSWDSGLLDGPELSWADNGQQLCEGVHAHGSPAGTWTFWHDNGALSARCSYDGQGRLHGPYVGYDAEGQPRFSGEEFEGKLDGHWTWYGSDGWEKHEKEYLRGMDHGAETAYHPGGVLGIRRNWRYSKRHGLEEVFDADGQITYRGEWRDGHPVGTHTAGQAVEVYVDGLPQALAEDTGKRDKILARLGRARDDHAREKIIRDVVGYSDGGAYLVSLWRAGFNLGACRGLWDMFADASWLLSGQDAVTFLRQVRVAGKFPAIWGIHGDTVLPHYTYELDLDRLVLEVYARDPGPVDEAFPTLAEPVRAGIAYVRGRLGHDIGTALHSRLPAVARECLNGYVWVRWPGLPGSQEVVASGERTPLFGEFAALSGTPEQWAAQTRRAALDRAASSEPRQYLPLAAVREAVANATPEEVVRLLSGTTSGSQATEIYEALVSWRADDAATTTRIVLELAAGEPHDGWAAVAAAIIAHRAEGTEPPQELADALRLVSSDGPTHSSEWRGAPLEHLDGSKQGLPAYRAAYLDLPVGVAAPGNALLREAMRSLPPAQARNVIERTMSPDSGCWREAAQYLHVVDDPGLWSRFIGKMVAEAVDYEPCWYGVGDLGARVVPLLAEHLEQATEGAWREGCGQAVLVALCRAVLDDGGYPQEHDRLFTFGEEWDDRDWQGFLPFAERVLWKLPPARAERILLNGLGSPSRFTFARAFGLIGCAPATAVLESAFTGLLRHENHLNSEQRAYVRTGMRSLGNFAEWVAWIRRSGGGAGLAGDFKAELGPDAYQQLDEELAATGAAVTEIDDVERLRLRAEQAGGNERIYVLRRGGGADPGTCNVIGGPAPGVDASRWPAGDDGELMTHLFTLDTATMPELTKWVGGNVRTVSVFCLRPDYNEAWGPGNDWTAVVCSTGEQLASAGDPPGEVEQIDREPFEAVAIDVNPKVWRVDDDEDDDWYDDDEDDDDAEADPELQELHRLIYAANARVLGSEIWLQQGGYAGNFLMQFDSGFCPINLGDCGVMYVYDDTAFWQCH